MKNMEKLLNEINKKLDEISFNQIYLNEKLDKVILNQKNDELDLNNKIDKINTDMKSIQVSANNMNTHISFIENVYDSIKNPFYFILNKVTKIDSIPEKQKLLDN